jgi:putative hydrolase
MKILGDYHTHTSYSDGHAPVIDMVRAGKERGLKEMAITDHGFRKILGGLRDSTIERVRGEIESARGELPVLFGIESNVVSCGGRIDVGKKHAEKFDIILCGVHVNVAYSFGAIFTFLLPNLFWRLVGRTPAFQRRHNTKICIHAIKKNHIDIWTHMNRYFRVNVLDVARACVERGTVIELNSRRISFRPIDFERMAALGAKFIIDSDAHKPRRVGDIARVEEFLKNCDFDPASIINLNQTWTEYKKGENEDVSCANKIGDPAKTEGERPRRRGFWHRR